MLCKLPQRSLQPVGLTVHRTRSLRAASTAVHRRPLCRAPCPVLRTALDGRTQLATSRTDASAPASEAAQLDHATGQLDDAHANSHSAQPVPAHATETAQLNESDSDANPGYASSATQQGSDELAIPGTGASVQVKGVSKSFGVKGAQYKAVDNVSLTVPEHSITALLGPSGSGKTTLLRMIAGLEQPTEGRIFIDDQDVTNTSISERNIGFTFQSYALFRHMTIADNIAFGPKVRRLNFDLQARVNELLELVELPGLGDRLPNQLSGGQRQRVALARALASNPQILLLDEPFGALDPLVRKNLRQGLRAIVKRVGVTAIMVTHDLEEAMDIADRLVIFNKGRIEQQGDKFEVASQPASPFVMNFMGDTNTVPANCQLVRRMGFYTTKPMVMFRPTVIEVSPADPSVDLATNRLCPATIADKKHIGWRVNFVLECDDGVRLNMHVKREEHDDKYQQLDTLQRLFLKINCSDMMGFTARDIDSSPLDLV